MRVLRIEREPGGGLRVVMTDGSVATYRSAADLPDELVGLLARLDSGDGVQPLGEAAAARARYQQRLEQAHEQGRLRHDPGQGLTGVDAYRARLEGAWEAPPLANARVGDHKRWQGA
jgi:hypothetical protein